MILRIHDLTMSLQQLPNELLLYIGLCLLQGSDINNLCRVNNRFYSLYNTTLYRHNLDCGRGIALLWAASHGNTRVIQKCFESDAMASTRYLKLYES